MKNKVVELIVDPLNAWFGQEMPQGKAVIYIDALNKYPIDILSKAFDQLKIEWIKDRAPQPAVIREICERLIPRIKPLTMLEKANLDFWTAAARIMPTVIGKLALSEGWARSLVADFMESGKMVYDNYEIQKFRDGRRKLAEIANTLALPEDKDLISFYQTLQKKEQQLIDKYKHLIITKEQLI